MHYYQHHIGDYLADTTHLTLLEHGVYLRLMMLYYQTECALNANALRLICARSADEVLAAETVLNEFFTLTDLGWVHGRCDAEIARFHGKSDKAKASAQARWSKKDANAMRTHSEGNANHKPITNNQEPITNKIQEAPRKARTPSALSILLDAGIGESVANDFLAIRKAKRAPLTETALDGIKREALKAGYPLENAIRECVIRGWQSFKADWVNKSQQNTKEESLAAGRATFAAAGLFGEQRNERVINE